MSANQFAEQAARCFEMAAEADEESVAKTLRDMGTRLLALAHGEAELTDVPHDPATTVVI